MKSFLLAFTVTFFCAVAGRAQVTFTYTATANADAVAGGYTMGAPYTFSFTTGPSFALNASSVFAVGVAQWKEEETSEDQLFISATGTGLTGAFNRPTANTGDPYSYLQAGVTSVALQLNSDATVDNGLRTLSATPLRSVFANAGSMPPSTFDLSLGSYVDPVSYYSGYTGSYGGITGSIQLLDSTSTTFYHFTVTSLTISAVPEPAAYTALAGLGALGLAALRRRRKAT